MNKFIITNRGELILGNVEFHFELLPKGEKTCNGGGVFIIDEINKVIDLFGRSFDFGAPKVDTINKLPNRYKDFSVRYEREPVIIRTVSTDNINKEKLDLTKAESIKNAFVENKNIKLCYDRINYGNIHNFRINGIDIKAKNKKEALKKYKNLKNNK